MRKFLKKIFSVDLESAIYRNRGVHLVITILGIKFKLRFQLNEPKKRKLHCIALVDAGGIGDYVFVRQYFKYFKQSPLYKDKPIIFFAPSRYSNFIKCYDGQYLDDIIIYDKNAFEFADDLITKLKQYQFDTVIYLSGLHRANNYFGIKLRYNLVKKIKAKEKIADVILETKQATKVQHQNLKIFTKIIYTKPVSFEMERRRQFFEQLLDFSLPQEDLSINPLFYMKDKYIAISAMAMSKKRNYSVDKWIQIVNYLLEKCKTEIKILFLGSNLDYKETQEIIEQTIDKTRCINLCGLTDATFLPILLQNAEFLISPETGTVHIAEAVGCKTICLCGGAHYNRFLPHKKHITYIYPKDFLNVINNNDETVIQEYYCPMSINSVDSIEVSAVKKVIDSYLNNY